MIALNLKATQVDKLAGLAVGYTRDFLDGRKTQPRAGKLAQLAEALDCDLDYLLMLQPAPRKGAMPEDGLMMIGVCEADTWRREASVDEAIHPTPYEADPRFPADEQSVFEVRDTHAIGWGIPQDAIVIVRRTEGHDGSYSPSHGDLVVVARYNEDLIELSIGRLEDKNGKLSVVRSSQKKTEVIDDVHVEGLILTSIKHFA